MQYIEEQILDFCINNDKNKIISSKKILNSVCALGIDEAGRGPVLGPMVYAGAYVEIKNMCNIKEIGLDDSKKLKEEVREELLGKLTDLDTKLCGFEVEIISPNYISNEMLNTVKNNLNSISHNSAINIIARVLSKGVNLREVYVDTVGSPEKYRDLILSYYPGLKVVVESKADSKFPVVSAASIFAKVIRDRCIKGWRHRERSQKFDCGTGQMCGSGYPSDPATQAYLQRIIDPVFGFPQFVRASWSTASVIVDEKCVPIQWEDNFFGLGKEPKSTNSRKRLQPGAELRGQGSMLGFVSVSNEKCRFFTERKMERIGQL